MRHDENAIDCSVARFKEAWPGAGSLSPSVRRKVYVDWVRGEAKKAVAAANALTTRELEDRFHEQEQLVGERPSDTEPRF